MKTAISLLLTLGVLFFLSCERPTANANDKKEEQKQPPNSAQKENPDQKETATEQPIPEDINPEAYTKPPFVLQNQSKPNEPDIDFDSRDINLGETEPGGKIETIIRVYNRGPKDLIVERIRSSCGCTAVWLENQEAPLRSGESRELKIILQPKQTQKVTKSVITFYSNDPAEQRAMIQTQASTKNYFITSPEMVNLGDIIQGSSTTARITVISLEGDAFEISQTYSQEPSISIHVGELKSLDQNRKGYPLELTFDSRGHRIGIFRSFIQVHVKHQKQQVIHIPIHGNISGEVYIQAADRALSVPYFDIGQMDNQRGPLSIPSNRALKLLLHETSEIKNFKILNIAAEAGPLSIQAVEIVPHKEFELQLFNIGGFRPGLFRQKFRIIVNNPRVPVYDVYIQGILRNRFDLTSDGLYIETAPLQEFSDHIILRTVKYKNIPLQLSVRGNPNQKLEYSLEAKTTDEVLLHVRGKGIRESFLEEVYVVEPNSGQASLVTIWVQVQSQ